MFLPVAAAAGAYVNRFAVLWVVSGYGAMAVMRAVAQLAMAAAVRRRRSVVQWAPMVSIVMTVYNPESLDLLRRVAGSIASQRWPRFEVIVVDDGSEDALTHRGICDRYGFRYLYQTNAGKRRAMHRAFAAMDPRSRYVLTADDDTVWHPDVTAHQVAALQADPRVGAAVGHVGTLNTHQSWLTRLVSVRYWIAFEIERAAQAYCGVVNCVSGPLGCYRRELIDQIADRLVSQRFLGRECTYGDDRHLTNLILRLGYRVTYSRAVAWTNTPATFRQYRRQQIRWGRSAWRETLWTFRALPRQSLLLSAEWALSLVLPFLLMISLGRYTYQAVTGSPAQLLMLTGMVVAMALVRAVPATASTRDPSFLWLMPVFGIFHLLVLQPIKLWALVTVADARWGTRRSAVLDAAALNAPTVPLPVLNAPTVPLPVLAGVRRADRLPRPSPRPRPAFADERR